MIINITPQKLEEFTSVYFPNYKQDGVSFHIDNRSNNIFTSGKEIYFPSTFHCKIDCGFNKNIVLLGIIFHEFGHFYDGRIHNTFEQLVSCEEFAQKWAIKRAWRKNRIIAEYLLILFYMWRRNKPIEDDPFSTKEENEWYRKDPYKIASLRNTKWILSQLKRMGSNHPLPAV